jgi:hypothetical protein
MLTTTFKHIDESMQNGSRREEKEMVRTLDSSLFESWV